MVGEGRDGAPRRITRDANVEEIGTLVDFVLAACRHVPVPDESLIDIRLAVEEACTNIVMHGYDATERGPISIEVRPSRGSVWIEITDRARRFTPSAVPQPDSRDWRERQPGGLGWHLIGKVMDDVTHDYEPGVGNRLTLVKRFAPDPAAEEGSS